MNAAMQAAQDRLVSLIAEHEVTAGMYVRVHGDDLILGRTEDGRPSDRVRLTRLASHRFGLRSDTPVGGNTHRSPAIIRRS